MRLTSMPQAARRSPLPAFALALFVCAVPVLPGCSDTNPTAPSTGGATILVDPTGGGDYLTIQGGITAAGGGDTVLVTPGTYTGAANRDLDFGGKNIVLKAVSARDSVIIDCQGSGRGFHLHSGEGPASIIEGFTVVGGYANRGGGAYLQGASPTFLNVIFRNNVAEIDGGGMYCDRDRSMRGASPALTNVIFEGNVAGFTGGGLFCHEDSNAALTNVAFAENEAGSGAGMVCIFADPTLTRVAFIRNTASFVAGGLYCSASSPVLEDVTFLTNRARNGGAMALSGSAPSITHATLVNNEAVDGGGIFCDNSSAPTIRKTIIAFNIGPGVVYCVGDDAPDTQRSCLYGNDGGDVPCGTYSNVLFVDPLLCSVNEDDLTLCSNSPCLPAGNPWSVRIGAYGEGCGDCGSTLGPAPWRAAPIAAVQ